MDGFGIRLLTAFVVFFVSAFIARKVVNKKNEQDRRETQSYCQARREVIDETMRKAEKEIAAARQASAEATQEIEVAKQEIAAAKNRVEIDMREQRERLAQEQRDFDTRLEMVLKETTSNLSAIPYMAGIIADYDTRGLEILASSLDWGANVARQKKVASIREIRKEVQEIIASCKESEYQLAYAIQMFPALEDFLDTEFNQLPELSLSDIGAEGRDAAKDFLSKEEYMCLSSTERNQLALDRYQHSHKKTKWQIGRDYELYVGYRYGQKGYTIDYYGSYNGLEDLGRDLIAKKGDLTLIIQCKYWGAGKLIHEKHINQLYGTMICYCYENNIPQSKVRAILVTNITVSETARGFAKYLGVELVENFAAGNYPCIKCNINHDEFGHKTKIYHLPFDQQYDSCKIDAPGEFFAMTVAEAENAGFRRAYRWHSNDC